MTLTEAEQNIGKAVTYLAYPGARLEDGVIKEVRGQYVMVHYSGDPHAKATAPHTIDLAFDRIGKDKA